MKCGDLFRPNPVPATTPCPHCSDPIVELDDGPVHFEAAANGARTAWGPCRTGDQAALFGMM